MRIRISRRRDADVSTRSRWLPLHSGMIMVGVALTTACSAQGGGGEAGGSSCVIAATYGGRTYTQVANVDFTAGKALGPAEFPPCDDTGHNGDVAGPEPTTAYAVDGLNPRIAIAVRYPSDEVMLLAVQPSGSLPPEVKALTRG
ncbi:DUF6281 family protein [Streptomyces sp. NPDC002088]|uniref:DUF6281 family protein n=1 Tax=Streptomyces sp. NPDC002088 TaxID=3154665 RepID=UPI003334974F